ncbi:MAG: hypothetical protein JO287_13530, partial [Pseudonocardiales bacterium]|nr:hypothetical protein [Pseudonocardiales bacterium]
MSRDSIDISRLSPEQRRALLTQLLLDQAEAPSSHPLSHGQQALWFLHKAAPQSNSYNILYAARVASDVDVSTLQRAAQALIDRHPMLRTTYTTQDGQPRQLVHRYARARFSVTDAGDWSDARIDEHLELELAHPFDLETGPVLRFELLRQPGTIHVLVATVHHIAVDFWSLDIMLDELRQLYTADRGLATPPPPPTGQYVDHIREEAQRLRAAEGDRLWRYWRQQLSGEVPDLILPTDRDRLALATFRGAVRDFRLSAQLTRRLRELAKAERTTLYVTILAAFFTMLHRYSGQIDIMVGSPMANRRRAGMEGVVGYFTNPVVLRADFSGDPTFTTFLRQVRATVMAAIDHQEYPFAMLVERLAPARELTRTPFFRASFVWDKPRRFVGPSSGNPGFLHLDTLVLRQGGAPSDLMMILSEGDSLTGPIQYST